MNKLAGFWVLLGLTIIFMASTMNHIHKTTISHHSNFTKEIFVKLDEKDFELYQQGNIRIVVINDNSENQ